jgi:hypothetical protein
MMSDGFLDNDPDLNARLDQAVPPHTRTLGKPDADPLIHLAQRVAQGPDVLFSNAALDRIEARLNAQMDTMALYSASPTTQRRRIRFGRLVRYAAAAVLTLFLIMTMVTQAAAAALPGDQLYPVKRAVEKIRITLVAKDKEASLRLTLAERRIDEFEALLEQDRVYPRALEEANDEMGRALDLLAAGHGDWADVDLEFRSLIVRDTFLLDQAALRADAAERVRLDEAANRVAVIQQHIETLNPVLPPVTPNTLPTPVSTMLPTVFPTASPSPTDTPTLTVTATPSMTQTPTLTPSPSPTASPTTSPTPMSTRQVPMSTSSPSGDGGGPPNGNPTPAQGNMDPGEGERPAETGSGQGGNPSPGKGK